MNDSTPVSSIFPVLPPCVFTDDSQDIRGFIFGHLTVVERLPDTDVERYKCLCKCGNTVNVTLYSLICGKRKRITCGKQCTTPVKKDALAQFFRAYWGTGIRLQRAERDRLRELRRAGASPIKHDFDFSI